MGDLGRQDGDLRQQIERSALPICAFAEEDKRILSACTAAAEKDAPTMPVSSCTNRSSRIKRTFFAWDFEAKVCSQSRRPRQFERIIFSSPVVDQLRHFLLLFIEITDNTLIMQFLYYCRIQGCVYIFFPRSLALLSYSKVAAS